MSSKSQESRTLFLKHLRQVRNLSPETCRSYDYDLRLFEEFQKEQSYPQTNVQQARQFVSFLYSKGLDKVSICRVLSTMRQYFEFLVARGEAKANPFKLIRNPKTVRRLPAFLEEAEVDRVFDEVRGNSFIAARNRAILEVLYGCGLRISELVGLDVGAVDLSDDVMSVTGKGSKERIVPFTAAVRRAVQEYLDERRKIAAGKNAALFLNRYGGRLSAVWVRKFLRRVVAAAGIDKRVTPHTLRHTFATHLLNNGADIRSVQELLGHTNADTTQRYTHVTAKKLLEVYNKFHPRGKK